MNGKRKCPQAQYADDGKPLVISSVFLAAGAANKVMQNMIRVRENKNLALAYVTVILNGEKVRHFGIVRKSVNGQ